MDPLDLILGASSARELATELAWEVDLTYKPRKRQGWVKLKGTGEDARKKPKYVRDTSAKATLQKLNRKKLRFVQMLERDRAQAQIPVATPAPPAPTPSTVPEKPAQPSPGEAARDHLIETVARGQASPVALLQAVTAMSTQARGDLAAALGVDAGGDPVTFVQAIYVAHDQKQFARSPGPVEVNLLQGDPDNKVARKIAGDQKALGVVRQVREACETLSPAGMAEYRRLGRLRKQYPGKPQDPQEWLLRQVDEARYQALHKQVKAANEKAKAVLRQALKPQQPFQPEIVEHGSYSRGTTLAAQRAVDQGFGWVASLCEDKGQSVRIELETPYLDPFLVAASKQGAYRRESFSLLDEARRWAGGPAVSVVSPGVTAGYAGDDTAEAVVLPQAIHAMAYALESAHPEIAQEAWDFLNYRTGRMRLLGENPVRMAGRYPKSGYMAKTYAYKDSFDRHFDEEAAYNAGIVDNKVHTHLLAMGLEALYKDPLGFLRNDPEYAAWVISVLQKKPKPETVPSPAQQAEPAVQAGIELGWTERPEGYTGKLRRWQNTSTGEFRYQVEKPGGDGPGEEGPALEETARAIRSVISGHPISPHQVRAAFSSLSRLNPSQVARLRAQTGLRMDLGTAKRVGDLASAALEAARQTEASPEDNTPASRGEISKEAEPLIRAVEADQKSRNQVTQLASLPRATKEDLGQEKAIRDKMHSTMSRMMAVPDGFDWGSAEGRALAAEIERDITQAESDLAAVEQKKRLRAQAAKRLLAVARPSRIRSGGVTALPDAQRNATLEATVWLGAIAADADVDVEFEFAGVGRVAGCQGGRITLGDEDGADVVIHELGHLLEEQHPGINRAVRAYLEYRCGNEPFVSLREVTGNPYYDEGETGRKDDFEKTFGASAWYVGKVYEDGGSELLSMSLQLLFNDPAALATRDPELCAFLIGVLQGRIRLANPEV